MILLVFFNNLEILLVDCGIVIAFIFIEFEVLFIYLGPRLGLGLSFKFGLILVGELIHHQLFLL